MFRLWLLSLTLFASSALAETAEDARKQLTGTLSEIKSSSEKHKELSKEQTKIENELDRLQEQSVRFAKDTKQQEEALLALEEKTSILEGQKREKMNALDGRKAELSEAISAMIKLSKLPPEAVIAMPGKLKETLSAARALGLISKAAHEEAESLKAQLHEIDLLEAKIAKNRESLMQTKTEHAAKQKQLDDTLKQRKKMYSALAGEAEEEHERLQKLTTKSKTLQDLVNTLASGEEARESPVQAKGSIASRSKHRSNKSFAQVKGKLGLPVAGKIVGLYGHSEGGAAFSKGVMIEARSAGNVVAPFDGEVVYAGVFRDYGKMVILRHSGDYHTLLSGLDEIRCSPGQFLLEGEPIGAMGKPAEGTKPKLYVEMRKSGKPVDPMSWFKG